MKVRIKNLLFTIGILSLLATFFTACSKDQGNKIVIKGSTTVLPITQKTAEAYRKINKVSISIEGSGSGNGIKALIDGTCDIANSSREMKAKELKVAKEKGIAVKEIPVALDMIVPVVHPSNSIENITTNQLKAIYDGSISNWKQIGGKDENIIVISRDTSSGTYEVWQEKIMDKVDVKKDALLQASNGAVSSVIAGNPKAIGYIGFGYLSKAVKPLNVNGILPTIENGKTGKFPIARKLYIYINDKTISTDAKKYIDYILGIEGQKLVEKAGYIPIN